MTCRQSSERAAEISTVPSWWEQVSLLLVELLHEYLKSVGEALAMRNVAAHRAAAAHSMQL